MKKILSILLTLLLAVAAANLLETEHTLETLEDNVIRLHILANSDSLEDQTKKLLVRDAVLRESDNWLSGCRTAEACSAAIREKLPEITQTSEKALRKEGCSDSVSVSFGTTDFPQRSYGDFTLPAGSYQSLNIAIGKAEGQNWWCIMYPALCVPAATLSPKTALPAAAQEMTQSPEQYEIRLKTLDVCRSIFRWLKNKLQST